MLCTTCELFFQSLESENALLRTDINKVADNLNETNITSKKALDRANANEVSIWKDVNIVTNVVLHAIPFSLCLIYYQHINNNSFVNDN